MSYLYYVCSTIVLPIGMHVGTSGGTISGEFLFENFTDGVMFPKVKIKADLSLPKFTEDSQHDQIYLPETIEELVREALKKEKEDRKYIIYMVGSTFISPDYYFIKPPQKGYKEEGNQMDEGHFIGNRNLAEFVRILKSLKNGR